VPDLSGVGGGLRPRHSHADVGATLIVALAMASAAAALIMSGIRRAKRIHPIPERSVESVKENFEWMTQPIK
jgi:hypothetical protein